MGSRSRPGVGGTWTTGQGSDSSVGGCGSAGTLATRTSRGGAAGAGLGDRTLLYGPGSGSSCQLAGRAARQIMAPWWAAGSGVKSAGHPAIAGRPDPVATPLGGNLHNGGMHLRENPCREGIDDAFIHCEAATEFSDDSRAAGGSRRPRPVLVFGA